MFSSKTKEESGPFCTSAGTTFVDFKEDWGERGLSFSLALDGFENCGERNNFIASVYLVFSSSWCFWWESRTLDPPVFKSMVL